jgi:hypothetical protein
MKLAVRVKYVPKNLIGVLNISVLLQFKFVAVAHTAEGQLLRAGGN